MPEKADTSSGIVLIKSIKSLLVPIFASMFLPSQLQTFTIGGHPLEIFVPQPEAVKEFYRNDKDAAFWAQVWPASIALCHFLQLHPEYVKDKYVQELAAGLGLAGLYAAHTARSVHISDIEVLAAQYAGQSARHLQLNNVTTEKLDWNQAQKRQAQEVLLLSDVNYQPQVFAELERLIYYFLERNATIILSTPQRLVAKQFINRFMKLVAAQWETVVLQDQQETGITVFVLTSGGHAQQTAI